MTASLAELRRGLPEGRRRIYSSRKPWPRPPVPGQEGKAPTVTEIPLRTRLHFQYHIGLRLLRQGATGWVRPLIRALTRPFPDALSDALILHLLFETVFSRFITTVLDPADEVLFASQISGLGPGDVPFKVDFSALARIHSLPGIYVAPSVTLGCIRQDGRRDLLAMRISGITLTPADGAAWALARYFFMQGAALHGLLVHHTPLHFQFDAIAAISESLLPGDHLLSKLLSPHFVFTLCLNQAALHSRLSILTNKRWLAYATFPGDSASTHHFQATGWSGISGNSAYPEFRFTRQPNPIFGPLGEFLSAYYKPIRAFTNQICDEIAERDLDICRWADAVSEWIPGFPDSAQIWEPGALADVTAMIVWGTSVVHSTEHYGLVERIPVTAMPMRLRLPPPFSPDLEPFDQRRLTHWTDMFRQAVAWQMLVRGQAVTRLQDTDYGFIQPHFQTANRAFLDALAAVDRKWGERAFIRLDCIARSIQF